MEEFLLQASGRARARLTSIQESTYMYPRSVQQTRCCHVTIVRYCLADLRQSMRHAAEAKRRCSSHSDKVFTACQVLMVQQTGSHGNLLINTREALEPIPAKVHILAQLWTKSGRTVFTVWQDFMVQQMGS